MDDAKPRLSLFDWSLKAIVERPETWTAAKYVTTGNADVDEALGGGLRQGGVTLVVGRSGRGKTTTAANWALCAAAAGVPVLYYSLELNAGDIVKLIASQVSGVPRRAIDRNNLTIQQATEVGRATKKMAAWPMTIIDNTAGITIGRAEIADITATAVEALGVRLVVVDYLNLIANDGIESTEYATDLANSAAMKALAQRNDVAVLCIAALRKRGAIASKQSATRQKSEAAVTMDDVLGAGRLVYDSTAVIHVNSIARASGGGELRLDILKTRFSAATNEPIILDWRPAHGRIESPVKAYDPERDG